VTSFVPTGTENMMVSDLMEEKGSEWKIDVIKEVFNERDAKNILAMPIIWMKWEKINNVRNLQPMETA